MLQTLLDNFLHNLFKPLLLFFYAGFLIPILGIHFEFPHVLYQGLTIYLLLAIGWHGGEELAGLPPEMIGQAGGFMVIGFLTNLCVGFTAYYTLRAVTKLRKVDAAAVAGYYGSDSAGTFVTCLGVLTASHIAFAAYMPVLLAVMEIPGCLVALILVSKMRRDGMDANGNMPNEPGFVEAIGTAYIRRVVVPLKRMVKATPNGEEALVSVGAEMVSEFHQDGGSSSNGKYPGGAKRDGYRTGDSLPEGPETPENATDLVAKVNVPVDTSLMNGTPINGEPAKKPAGFGKLMHEVFLNPGTFLLFAGIVIGFVGRIQGERVVTAYDSLFNSLFQGLLCLFLLEMGMTASKRLRDLKTAGWRFVAFALIAPNVFATTGICVAHAFSMWLGQPFELGTYVLFAVLCGSASYIAMPALQRMAIPEASPTLPLAASLGLTFSYNVTIGIPLYLMIATAMTNSFPVLA